MSGYFGGVVDNVIQRITEFLMSFPAIPMWMGLAAALPPHWSSLEVYFGITIILSIIGWGGLARQIRGKVLSLKRSISRLDPWVLKLGSNLSHLFPNCLSHIIVVATLSIPGMI